MNRNAVLRSTIPAIDMSHYRSVLRDQSAVGQVEKVLGDFKPVDYDLGKWNGVVEAFQGKAVSAVLSSKFGSFQMIGFLTDGASRRLPRRRRQ